MQSIAHALGRWARYPVVSYAEIRSVVQRFRSCALAGAAVLLRGSPTNRALRRLIRTTGAPSAATGSQDPPALRPAMKGPYRGHEELTAARTELSSLSAAVSPSRFERALERVQAAQEALAPAA